MQLDVVDQPGGQALAGHVGAAAQGHDAVAGRLLRHLDGVGDPLDEHELDRAGRQSGRAAVSHHDVRNPIGRVVPAAGVLTGPKGAAAEEESARPLLLADTLVGDGDDSFGGDVVGAR